MRLIFALFFLGIRLAFFVARLGGRLLNWLFRFVMSNRGRRTPAPARVSPRDAIEPDRFRI